MGILIGMDEAGYGPNLGPLVLTATVWEVPGRPDKCDLWRELAGAVTRSPRPDDERLHVADSKQVYSPARGIAELESSVLAALAVCGSGGAGIGHAERQATGLVGGAHPATFRELVSALVREEELDGEPWFVGADLPLPAGEQSRPLHKAAETLAESCRRSRIRLLAVHSDVVLTGRFNRLVGEHGNKAAVLSRSSLKLLRRVWDPDDGQPTLIVADRHGGRHRYDEFLHEVLDGRLIFGRDENAEVSRYRIGKTEIRFEVAGESHLPVALASMVSKYVRELAMILFNRFWAAHVPGLKPTAGYPADAGRFRNDVAAARKRLKIDDAVFWRVR